MPMAPRTPCGRPGCRHLKPCPVHVRHKAAGQTYQDRISREPWHGWYQTQRWRRLRKAVLAERPMCECHDCKGERWLAEVVDHKQPHRGDVVAFFDVENLQPMAKRCHDRKTAREVWAQDRR